MVFALIDSLTLQSAFSGVRLESYMFTEQSFRAVRDVLKPDGVLVVYNYFREPWLVDRLANTAAAAFGTEPMVHVHPAKDQLGVIVVGPRLKTLAAYPVPPSEVNAYNQGAPLAPPVKHVRDAGVVPATDNWPFLYMREPHLPSHYLSVLAVILLVSAVAVFGVVRGAVRKWSWEFFFLGAGLHAAGDEVHHPVRAAVGIDLGRGVDDDRGGAGDGAPRQLDRVARRDPAAAAGRRGAAGAARVQLLRAGRHDRHREPPRRVGRATACSSSAPSSARACCSGRASSDPRTSTVDYGANLLGAMVGGVAEYLSLLMGFQFLLILVAGFYVAALATRKAR